MDKWMSGYMTKYLGVLALTMRITESLEKYGEKISYSYSHDKDFEKYPSG